MKAITQAKATAQTVLGWRHMVVVIRPFGWGAGAGASAAAASSSFMTSMATRTRSSAGPSSWSRAGDRTASRARRTLSSAAWPSALREITVARASSGSDARCDPAGRLEALELGGDRRLAAVIGGREDADPGGAELVEEGEQRGPARTARRTTACRLAQRDSRAAERSSSLPRVVGSVTRPNLHR